MTASVADRVKHRLPRPICCDNCGSPRVALQKRSLMGMRAYHAWDLVWHCGDCLALVGCHEGTDIPYGLMADSSTREARSRAHKVFDRLWRGRGAKMTRAEAYAWMASTLAVDPSKAHIGMLDERQCDKLIEAAAAWKASPRGKHWKQRVRKKRRN